MVLEPDTGRCATLEAEPQRRWTRGRVPALEKRMSAQWGCWAPKGGGGGGWWVPTSVGEENETFFIRMRKPLPSRRVLETLSGSSKGKVQKGQYLLAMGLNSYRYCSQFHPCLERWFNLHFNASLNVFPFHDSLQVVRVNFFRGFQYVTTVFLLFKLWSYFSS